MGERWRRGGGGGGSEKKKRVAIGKSGSEADKEEEGHKLDGETQDKILIYADGKQIRNMGYWAYILIIF